MAGNVTITIAGGTISGDIYSRGQTVNDSVSGAVNVIFTGAGNYGCGVWGYSYGGSTGVDDDVTLSFNGYTGTFSGKVGGFNDIKFNDGTAMTLATEAADVNNKAWTFDLSARDEALSGTSLLTWGAEAGFSDDKVTVNFADEAQAKAGWSIADAAFTGATFDLWIGGAATTAVDLTLDQAISGTSTAYDGWGFKLENGTLKFAQITA